MSLHCEDAFSFSTPQTRPTRTSTSIQNSKLTMASRILLRRLSASTPSSGSLIRTRFYVTSIHSQTTRAARPPRAVITPFVAKASTVVGAANEETTEAAPESPDVSPFLAEKQDESPTPGSSTDWSKSYHGLSTQAFSKDVADILLAPVDPQDVEVKPGMHTT